jgi:hypothetical protein
MHWNWLQGDSTYTVCTLGQCENVTSFTYFFSPCTSSQRLNMHVQWYVLRWILAPAALRIASGDKFVHPRTIRNRNLAQALNERVPSSESSISGTKNLEEQCKICIFFLCVVRERADDYLDPPRRELYIILSTFGRDQMSGAASSD